jgi:hypothetical protein
MPLAVAADGDLGPLVALSAVGDVLDFPIHEQRVHGRRAEEKNEPSRLWKKLR